MAVFQERHASNDKSFRFVALKRQLLAAHGLASHWSGKTDGYAALLIVILLVHEEHRWKSTATIEYLRTHGLQSVPNSIKAIIGDLVYNGTRSRASNDPPPTLKEEETAIMRRSFLPPYSWSGQT